MSLVEIVTKVTMYNSYTIQKDTFNDGSVFITLSDTNNYMTQTTNGNLYLADGTTLYESTDGGDNLVCYDYYSYNN